MPKNNSQLERTPTLESGDELGTRLALSLSAGYTDRFNNNTKGLQPEEG